MEYAASVAILCRELIAARQGTERFKIAGTKEITTPVVLYPQVHAIALETADRFDRRNGTTWQATGLERGSRPPRSPLPSR